MNEVWETHKGPIIGALAGLLIALLMLTLGFFKTVLIIVFVILGGFVGWYATAHGWIDIFLSNKRK
ncbi:hypothetical protein A5819_001394 [Enterococcus sp. 7E2_DIV0204]|uniref:DUF2273 domain-containing protein n=2 Tax=Enterococcus TaxID=1350 RepID=A0ABZ2T6V7_9ENTE|nr:MULTISPECIES: DUF2273 domain-containing protein [Enterococcus]ALS36473.1 hypothetical protein ATZ35_04645 [Enterococcus rotai]OTN88902.1 hypothetical protein A5819_001394 [Enterococcus sp. 7E2_DIV0204]OTO71069.1 hypothetical protein A5866_003319 [Enterococcus sp. 12C11_DIV0727]OTP46631.1 hypothetical protein A5884_003786 [Enterococcus sp. 7D2_DIV0200]